MNVVPISDRIFELVPADPGTCGFRLHVSDLNWRGDTSISVGTTYDSLVLQGVNKPRPHDGFGGYVFQMVQNADVPGWRSLYFFPAKDTTAKNEPLWTWYSREDYHWPTVLELLQFHVPKTNSTGLESWGPFTTPHWTRDFYGTSGIGVRENQTPLVVKKRVRESHRGLTTLRFDLFQSPTPWTNAEMSHLQHADEPLLLGVSAVGKPQPNSVWWDLPGNTDSVDDCLHGLIYIPPSYAEDEIYRYDGATDTWVASGTVPPSVARRTYWPTDDGDGNDCTTWKAHTANDEVKRADNLFQRLRVTAILPPMPTIET